MYLAGCSVLCNRVESRVVVGKFCFIYFCYGIFLFLFETGSVTWTLLVSDLKRWRRTHAGNLGPGLINTTPLRKVYWVNISHTIHDLTCTYKFIDRQGHVYTVTRGTSMQCSSVVARPMSRGDVHSCDPHRVLWFNSVVARSVTVSVAGTPPNIKVVLPGMGITIIKIRRSWDHCLIFEMGIHKTTYLYWDPPLVGGRCLHDNETRGRVI